MTKLLDDVLVLIRALPDKDQDEAARTLVDYLDGVEEREANSHLSWEELRELRDRKRAALRQWAKRHDEEMERRWKALIDRLRRKAGGS